MTGAPLFDLGQTVATPGAVEVLDRGGGDWRFNAAPYLLRHQTGDWGEVPPEDARENERSLKYGWRVVSLYPVGDAGEKEWIITEAGRPSTCILLPEDY